MLMAVLPSAAGGGVGNGLAVAVGSAAAGAAVAGCDAAGASVAPASAEGADAGGAVQAASTMAPANDTARTRVISFDCIFPPKNRDIDSRSGGLLPRALSVPPI